MPEYKVLGTTQVRSAGRDRTPTPAKVRQVLALLLLRGNQVVHIDAFIDELWGDDSPRTAVTTAQTYIYQLRKSFARDGVMKPGQRWLLTRPPGYMLLLEPGELDAEVFESTVHSARKLMDDGRAAQAEPMLRRALEMWTGPALADVTKGRQLSAHAVHLEEQRMRALELCVQAGFALGRTRELVGELRSLTVRYPLNEWFHGQLMAALADCGRRSEALGVYHNLRMMLDEELGLTPSEEIKRMQHRILNEQPVLA
ncbi:AfsR/SARP family transcriptional regulator [Streptomyces sp. MST-110588]|uniref:AfsR/SARP family transcriptional regulator n=1 Tax=Streptomyces sp. MST-110588 TaxID=2833628 RepID=UPI001F5C8820|nr:AfsR/SARP family transcriptional regulator [Streptomyces sp. MST-110588]UNO40794.1 AfsR/SARP family transcriptional regulator [Streptomyces sp. MST-110588]